MANANATAARPPWRMRFSLRRLLLLATAFAIAFPVWYRWPHEEVEYGYPTRWISPVARTPDKSKPPTSRTVKTWQRTWGSLRPQHIRTVLEQYDYGVRDERNYKAGKLHGLYSKTFADRLYCTGQYSHDKRDGEWRTYEHGAVYIAQWKADRLDGVFTIEPFQGNKSRLLFDHGTLLEIDGIPIEDFLSRRLESAANDNKRIAAELRKPLHLGVEFYDTPLQDVIQYLIDQGGLTRIYFDKRNVPDPAAPVTVKYAGLDYSSVLTLTARRLGLEVDVRYGVVWITSSDDVRNCIDPTGVSDIRPPPGSALAAAWDSIDPLGIEDSNVPLESTLQGLANRQGFAAELDTSQIAPSSEDPNRHLVTVYVKGLPLRHSLGIILAHANCRCKLEAGKLVIMPPEQPGGN
jgi:hypothetical protein